MITPGNLFANIPPELPEEHFETLLAIGGLRIERIVSLAHVSPDGFWYDQDTHEWVLLLRGAARLRFKEPASVIEMAFGQFIHIPAHTPHRVEWTDPTRPTIWLAIHYKDVAVDGDRSPTERRY